MSLCNLKKVLAKAQKERYGILATVLFNFDFAEAVLSAAEEKRSPVVLMISEPLQNEYPYFNFNRLIRPIIDMSEDSSVPVVLHLDHGQSYESITKYIDSGLTSVMISGLSCLEENIGRAKLNTRDHISFTELNHRSMQAVNKKAKWLMDIFGSTGKA